MSVLEALHERAVRDIARWVSVRVDADADKPTFILDRLRAFLKIQSEPKKKEISAAGSAVASHVNGLTQILRIGADQLVASSAAKIALWRKENVGLIRTIGQEYLGRIEDVLAKTSAQDLHVVGVANALQRSFDVSASRAEFWARDQILKLNSNLTQDRYKQAGIKRYLWISSSDERVRDRHQELADASARGVTYSIADPPIVDLRTRRRANPGEDFQCRCTMQPVFS